eukprot:7357633-Prymnesium_polylepis.3
MASGHGRGGRMGGSSGGGGGVCTPGDKGRGDAGGLRGAPGGCGGALGVRGGWQMTSKPPASVAALSSSLIVPRWRGEMRGAPSTGSPYTKLGLCTIDASGSSRRRLLGEMSVAVPAAAGSAWDGPTIRCTVTSSGTASTMRAAG